MKRLKLFLPLAGLIAIAATPLFASDPPPPKLDPVIANGDQRSLRFEPYPGAQSYWFFSGTNPAALTANTNFFLAPYVTGYTVITNVTTNGPVVITVTNLAYEWRLTNVTAQSGFYSLGVSPLSSNALLTANLLNRLAYGPTPDELERVTGIGPQAYIDEQINMEGTPEGIPNTGYTLEMTNAIPSDPTTNWVSISLTGTLAQTTFYLFTTAPGEAYLDDIELRPFRYMQRITTNVVSGNNVYVTNKVFSHISTNILKNGDFEAGYSYWTNAGGAASSAVDSSRAHSGSSCLRMVSTTGASSPGTSYVRQGFVHVGYPTTNTWGDAITLTNVSTDQVVLTYWYLPGPSSSNLRLQLGSGINSTPGGLPATPTWIYAKATGRASANSRLYIYTSGAGECYVDDLKLVAGTDPDAGPNLLQNGGFELPLAGSWTNSADFAGSTLSPTVAHSGNSSLRLVATAGGSGNNDSIQQTITPALVNSNTYTVSYWYLPATQNRTLTVKLDGNLLQSTPDVDLPGLNRKLDTKMANLGDYRAWFCLRAVQSQRQLFEVLSQFWENHFVTQQSKSAEYFASQGYDGTMAGWLATDWEFREMTQWRNAMLNPNCTFYDLLKISCESPAMIVYLDSVNSRGNGNNIANENYARELLELFTFGVDNGYDQNDIVLLSRAWTGWSVEIVDPPNANNPFAPRSLTLYPGTNSTSGANTIGTWAFNFKPASHGTNRGAIFGGKTVPARFGPPWAGMPYQISLPARGAVTNGILDGYDVIASLANLPFTSEYISVKLCRLFVHDDFPNPNTIDPDSIGYTFYDYTNPARSEEAELVHQCMLAWENSSPKGNLRAVLNTIFSSELFRSHAAAAQKVKTPFEFVTSSIRALRSLNPDGTATANTDGLDSSFANPMNRMGGMLLFDRAAPDGYPENGAPWISAGTLVERIRFIQAFLNAGTGDDAGNNICDPVALLKKKLPAGSWNNAGAVADFFLGVLYPGEGMGNLSLYRTAAVNFLNTDDSGNSSASTQFNTLNAATTDTRVRGMVSMLMAFQRFQEQ